MPDKWAVADGNWSNTATWNGGVKPAAGDDVYADGWSVTVDENTASVNSANTTQRAGGTAGGNFTLSNGVTFSATTVQAGSTTCVHLNGSNSGTLSATTVAGGSGASDFGVSMASTGTLTLSGGIQGGTNASAYGLNISANGTINLTGNVDGNANTYGARINSDCTLSITGNITGGSGTQKHGIYQGGNTATITVTGDVTGGSGALAAGVYVASTCDIRITGNVSGGSSGNRSPGLRIGGNTTYQVTGTVTAAIGNCSGIEISTLTADGNIIGDCVSASDGTMPFGGGVLTISAAANVSHTYRSRESVDDAVGAAVTLGGEATLASPTLAVADDADGTGATLTITGGDASAVNTAYYSQFGGGLGSLSWVEIGNRSGNGTIDFSTTQMGYYLFYVESVLGAESQSSNTVYQNITNGSDAVQKQCLDAVRSQILTLGLTDDEGNALPSGQVYIRKVATHKGDDGNISETNYEYPCILISPHGGEKFDHMAGTNSTDEVHYPVRVRILASDDWDQDLNFGAYLLWRQKIFRMFRNDRLSGVSAIDGCDVEPQAIVDDNTWNNDRKYDSKIVFYFLSCEPRGI